MEFAIVYRLIEELMLLANMAVAHKIKARFPEKCILLHQLPPQVKPLEEVVRSFIPYYVITNV